MNGRLLLAAGLATCSLVTATSALSEASFTASATNAGNSVATAPDWAAPTVAAGAVLRQGALVPGAIAPGASYYVYASVADSGNPASGVAGVTVDLSSLTPAATSVALSPGSWTVDGVSYDYRAGPLTAASGIASPAAFSFNVSDRAGNSATAGGFSVVVDSTPPAAVDVQAANGSGIAGRLDAGDTLTLTFSEQIDTSSISSGWDGLSPLAAVVRLNRGTAGADDNLTFYDAGNVAQLPLGSVDLGRNDFTSSNLTFGASGTASTVAAQLMSNGTTQVTRLTITLGSASGAAKTAKGAGTMAWQPSAGILDLAGNAMTSAPATETGALDVDF